MRERHPAAAAVAVVCALAYAGGTGTASASFAQAPAASSNFAAAVLAPPTSPAAAVWTCTLLQPSIRVTWTATASTWADGYEVGRSLFSGGPYTYTAVAGQATTAYVDPGLTALTSYYYVVRATKAGWRSPLTAEVMVTTGTC